MLSELSQIDLFQKVSDICETVNGITDGTELFEVSLVKMLELFDANRGSIFILADNGKDLILESSVGMQRLDREKMVKRLGEGIVGKVAETKQPIVVDDITQDDRFQNFKAREGYQTLSFICAPLMIKDKLVGVINITDKESGLSFNENELQLLDFLSSQIALNYRRVQIYQKFEQAREETEQLKDKLGQSDKETEYLKKKIILQEKLATVGKLAGGIAHEFNNPLDGVMRYTNLCLEHVSDDVVRGYLLEIKHGLNRMANIVKSLLACARNEPKTNAVIHFEEVLNRSLSCVQSDIADKNIQVRREIQENLPMIKDLGLERILTNLIRNGVDEMEDKGIITVRANMRDDIFWMEVEDTGCGVEEDNIQQMFEPFYTTKDIDKGFGLGLTIVGEIVKNYRGKIDVASEVGKGTTFTIRIPITT